MQGGGGVQQSPDSLGLDPNAYQQPLYLQQEHSMQSMNVRWVNFIFFYIYNIARGRNEKEEGEKKNKNKRTRWIQFPIQDTTQLKYVRQSRSINCRERIFLIKIFMSLFLTNSIKINWRNLFISHWLILIIGYGRAKKFFLHLFRIKTICGCTK